MVTPGNDLVFLDILLDTNSLDIFLVESGAGKLVISFDILVILDIYFDTYVPILDNTYMSS